MYNFNTIQKDFINLIKNFNYADLEDFVLANDNAFAVAFEVWSKLDDVAYENHQVMTKPEYNLYTKLSGALQI